VDYCEFSNQLPFVPEEVCSGEYGGGRSVCDGFDGWRIRTLWRGKVNDVSVALEHVDLLNCLDGLDVHLLECRLELLVVCASGLVHLLDLSSWGTLASVQTISSVHFFSCLLVRRHIPCLMLPIVDFAISCDFDYSSVVGMIAYPRIMSVSFISC